MEIRDSKGRYVKGSKPWISGKKHSKDTIIKFKNIKKNKETSIKMVETRKKNGSYKHGEEHQMFGKHHSIETRKKISESNKLKKTNLGKKFSESWKKNISESRKKLYRENKIKPYFLGKRKSRESVEKGVRTRIINNSYKPWNKGINHSIETRKKISIAHTGKKMPEKLKEILKEVRKNIITPKKDTSIEIKIQNYLKQLKIGFFTHIYMDEILNSYQCDIFIPVQKNKEKFIKQPIIIECDGDYWHCYPVGREIDKLRTLELIEKGFKVIRLWEHEIKDMDINKFQEIINVR